MQVTKDTTFAECVNAFEILQGVRVRNFEPQNIDLMYGVMLTLEGVQVDVHNTVEEIKKEVEEIENDLEKEVAYQTKITELYDTEAQIVVDTWPRDWVFRIAKENNFSLAEVMLLIKLLCE